MNQPFKFITLPVWTCKYCGQEHTEITDHMTCENRKECIAGQIKNQKDKKCYTS